MKELKTVAKGGFYSMLGSALSPFLSYFFLLLASHLLGAERLGAYYWADSITILLGQFAMMGMGQGIVYFAPQYERREGANSSLILLRTALVIALFNAALLALLLFLFAPRLVIFFHKPELLVLLRIFALTIPIIVVWPIFKCYFISRFNIKTAVIFGDFMRQFIRIGALVLLALIGLKYFALIGSNIISGLALIAAGFFFCRLIYGAVIGRRLLDFVEMRRMAYYSLPFLFFGTLKVERILTMIIAYYLGVSDIAVFNVAIKIAVLGNFLMFSLNSLFAPMTTALIVREQWDSLRSVYQAITRWIFIGTLPLFYLIIVYPGSLLNLFGPKFISGSGALVVIAFGFLFYFGTGSTSTVINMSGRTWQNLGNILIQLIATVIAALILVPRFNIIGAAAAFSFGLLIVNLIQFVQAYRIIGVLPYSVYLLKPIAAIVPAGLLTAAIAPPGQIYSFISLILIAAFFIIVYGIIILLLGFNKEDIILIRSAAQKIGIRLPDGLFDPFGWQGKTHNG